MAGLLIGANVRAPHAQEARTAHVAPSHAPPMVLYTDLASGPNKGGEGNKGAYLSIFGKHFGDSGLGTRIKVLIGGVEVANYRYLGKSKGRADIQQLTVQVGALGNPPPGRPLPVQVIADGIRSNTDQTFTVNPGRILFVDNVTGNDLTAVPGDIHHPFRHVQTPTAAHSAFDVMSPGDVIVMRGTGVPWSDLGVDSYFIKFIAKNGSAPTGKIGTGPFTLTAYPGEDVFIDMDRNPSFKGGISGVDTTQWAGGRWITISDLRIESGGHSGVIAEQIKGDHWRIVNNDLSAATGARSNAMAGGINGNGTSSYWVGNHIHDISGGPQLLNHGIYIDGNGSYEVAYNWIQRVTGGSGFQIFVNGGNGSNYASHVHFHHNLISDVAKYGINIADGSTADIAIYDNVVYNISGPGLRFNTNTLRGARIFNNTFYGSDTNGNDYDGIITNDWWFPKNALTMRDNIFVLTSSRIPYSGGSVGMYAGAGIITHNLYWGGRGTPNFDRAPIIGDPRFVRPGSNFHLRTGSPAIGAGGGFTPAGPDFDCDGPDPSKTPGDIGALDYWPG